VDVDAGTFERILTRALGAGDYADAFYERRVSRSYRLQDGRIHEAGLSLTAGVGIRVVSGECSGYAYSDDLSNEALMRTAAVASLIAKNGGERRIALPPAPATPASVYEGEPQLPTDSAAYVALLMRADAAARAYDPRITAVNGFISEELQAVVVATSEGRFITDRRPLVTLAIQTVANGKQRGNGYYGDGRRAGLEFYQERTPEDIARESARIAIVNSEAVEAPAGELEVVVGSGGGGVLLHEEKVANELVTIFDDGNLAGERGSLSIDDEGTPSRHNVLVERGVLRSYLQDHLNASLMNVASNGCGRRQSFRSMPQPRMCNTYMPAGDSTYDEIVGSVKRGVYAKSFSGGQVDISRGDFVFMVAEGYLIEDGRLAAPIRGATLIGNGPAAMTRVVMVGDDPRLASGSYTCGKGGQYVPVGVGMPTVKISHLTVGGSAVG